MLIVLPKHFLTALLFSSARLPFSDVQKKAVLSWAKELGAHDVPSLKAVKESNEHICELVGNPMRKVTSASGNVFYINDIWHAIAKVNYKRSDYPMLTMSFRTTRIHSPAFPCKIIQRMEEMECRRFSMDRRCC
jgi:hypothetical protein